MIISGVIEKMYAKRPLRVSLHLAFWAIFILLRFYLTSISFNVYRGFPTERIFLLNACSTFYAALFYYSLITLIVQFRSRKKGYLLISGLVVPLFCMYGILDTVTEVSIIRSCSNCLSALSIENPAYYSYLHQYIVNIILQRIFSLGTLLLLIFMLSLPFCIRLVLQAFRNELSSARLAKSNLQLELNFLKAQLNPHFLFNCLNNIYGLILTGDNSRSAGLVARLSEVLRYILYESDQHTMPVTKEVKLVEDFIELEKIRLNHTTVEFDYHSDGSITTIAPLLIMPLIENAFKFGADHPGSFIKISWEISLQRLAFTIVNTKRSPTVNTVYSGIGLVNFKKRMDLYYAGKYDYNVDSTDEIYSANLSINL